MLKFFNFIIVVLVLTSCQPHSEKSSEWLQKDGYISNEISAIKIAEIVWLNVYGEKINRNKPFNARLVDGKIWVVQGTLEEGKLGGVPYIEIQKSDCKILKVTHGK